MTSRWPSRYCSRTKKMVSSSRPNRTFLFVNQLPTSCSTFFHCGRAALRSVYFSPISLMPFFKAMTPNASKAKAMRRMIKIFVISQILVANQLDAELLDQFLHTRTDQGVEFMPKLVQRRMGVKLGIAVRRIEQHIQTIFLVHERILQQAERDLRVLDAAPAERFAGTAGKPFLDRRVRNAVKPASSSHAPAACETITREPQVTGAERVCILQQDFKNNGMQVQVQMAVDVVERQAGGVEPRELRVDLGAKLFTQAALEEIIHADADGAVAKFALRIDEPGDLFRRQGGMAHQQREMQTDAKPGIFLPELHGFVAAGFVDHQARSRQNAVAMRADDGFVHGMRKTEIIRVDDETAG